MLTYVLSADGSPLMPTYKEETLKDRIDKAKEEADRKSNISSDTSHNNDDDRPGVGGKERIHEDNKDSLLTYSLAERLKNAHFVVEHDYVNKIKEERNNDDSHSHR